MKKRKINFLQVCLIVGITFSLFSSCSKDDSDDSAGKIHFNSNLEYGTVSDNAGNVYKTIKIGKQVWMAQNLAFKTDEGCWAYENNEDFVPEYGYLYTWQIANQVCPTGWHLPSKEELEVLINFVGINGGGGKLKESGFYHWETCDEYSNEFGLTILPAGERNYETEEYRGIGSFTMIWTSTEYDYDDSQANSLFFGNKMLDIEGFSLRVKTTGLAVRCIKN